MTEAQQKRFFLLSARVAILNLKSWANEIEACGVALNTGAITLEDAVAWLGDLGLVEYMPINEKERAA
jgi:hypothetical protein